MTVTAREFKNCPVTMTLTDWIASASAAHKAKMDNKTRKRYSKRTYDCANREDEEKKNQFVLTYIPLTCPFRRKFPTASFQVIYLTRGTHFSI